MWSTNKPSDLKKKHQGKRESWGRPGSRRRSVSNLQMASPRCGHHRIPSSQKHGLEIRCAVLLCRICEAPREIAGDTPSYRFFKANSQLVFDDKCIFPQSTRSFAVRHSKLQFESGRQRGREVRKESARRMLRSLTRAYIGIHTRPTREARTFDKPQST